MLKFLHTADIHLGSEFKWLGDKAGKQRQQIKETFEKIVDTAIDKKVDIVLIAGDIFDNPYPSEINTYFFRDQLYKLSDNSIKVVVLPGNHDRLEDGSVFTRNDIYQSDPNIFLLNNISNPSVNIPELDLSVFGNPTIYQKSKQSPLKGLIEKVKEAKSKFKIVVAHGSYEMGFKVDNYPIKKEELEELNVQYIAMGDWHSYLDISTSKNKAIYSGSPELIEYNQTGCGYVVIGEIDDNLNVKTEKVKVGKREFKEFQIELGSIKDMGELIKLIEKEANEDLVLNLVFKGNSRFFININELKESIEAKYFYLSFKDESYKEVDWDNYSNLEENTIVYEYVKILKEKIRQEPDKEELKEALSYGVNLLKGKINEN